MKKKLSRAATIFLGAMLAATGADASLTGRIAKLTNRERLWLQPFSEAPYGLTAFEVPAKSGFDVKAAAPAAYLCEFL